MKVVDWDVGDTAAGTAAFVVLVVNAAAADQEVEDNAETAAFVVFAAVEEIGIASVVIDIFLLRAQYPIFERDLVTV